MTHPYYLTRVTSSPGTHHHLHAIHVWLPNSARTQVIAHQGEQVDPELAALEKQLIKGHLPSSSKDVDLGIPSFEWHIVMEYCDKGSLSRALSSFMLHTPVDVHSVKWDAWSCLEILKEITRCVIEVWISLRLLVSRPLIYRCWVYDLTKCCR